MLQKTDTLQENKKTDEVNPRDKMKINACQGFRESTMGSNSNGFWTSLGSDEIILELHYEYDCPILEQTENH